MNAYFPSPVMVDMGQPLQDPAVRLRLCLQPPYKLLQAHSHEELLQVLDQVEQAARAGACCIGGLPYEAAAAFNPQLTTHQGDGLFAWFAVGQAVQMAAVDSGDAVHTLDWHSPLQPADFAAQIAHIHQDIANGHYYQINLTQQLQGRSHTPVHGAALFAALQQAQPGGYAVYMDTGEQVVASVSPELFFDWHQPAAGSGQILTRPMKGTAARGANAQQDAAQAQQLQASAKERAENVMIVDLLRNDLGQIAEVGSVQVPSLFNVQALPSVWQMTSDVRAKLPQGTELVDVFKALFPCGSVTGAPKRAAMQAIAELETQPRGWYCGALGVVRSDGAGGIRATFNVPIRTVVVQGAQRQTLRCGIGSGVTASATAEGEWQEWRAKQAFVERVSMDFDVITTMALDAGQWRHLPLHVQRLQSAAEHFGYAWQAQALHLTLQQVQDKHPSGLWRVRIALARNGLFSSQVVPATPLAPQAYMQLAAEPLLQAHSEFVRFKTSRRVHYDRFAPANHVLDTILWNEAGQITEGTRGNVAALVDGQWVTPALSCGLLNGVGRQVALAEGRVVEGVIRVDDVHHLQQWAFINSLRGWVPAQLLPVQR